MMKVAYALLVDGRTLKETMLPARTGTGKMKDLVLAKLGSEKELEKEAFRGAGGDKGCSRDGHRAT